jgi:hypothetical protein
VSENNQTEIKISTLKLIYNALLPTYYKLESLLSDVLSGTYVISAYDRSLLLEQCSVSLALKCLFEEYFKEAEAAAVNTLYLKEEEFVTVLSLAKSVEIAERTMYKNTGIWPH